MTNYIFYTSEFQLFNDLNGYLRLKMEKLNALI